MSDYNEETAEDRRRRRERALILTSGARSASDNLTDSERLLLMRLRAQGLDLRHGVLLNERRGEAWQHGRILVQGSPSWSHSID